MKYHPDRNPGREAEFNAKFQAIQAAHEILSDPQQRLKYDTERLRAGYGKLYGPPQSNQSNGTRRTNTSSYPSAASGKAPTAKAAFPQRSSYQAPPSTGAQRYASYTKTAPQQPWEKVYEAQTRADAFRGFQEMKSGANASGWSKFDPRTGKPTQQQTGRSTPTAMPAGNASRMKSAYEHVNSKQASPGPSRSQSAKKKQGFAPSNPGGDEPMARNVSSYSSTPRADRTSAFFDSVPSKKSPVESSRPASPQEDYAIPEFERTSTRYATTGGEKTYFSSAGLGRSTSMRDSSGSSRTRPRTNPPSPTSPLSGRHHSASPKLKTHRDRTFSSSTSSSDVDEDERPQSKPKAIPKSRLRPNQKISDFYSPKDWNPGFGEDSSGRMNAPQFRDYFRSWNSFGSSRPHSYDDYVDRNYTDSECHKGFTYRSEHPFPTAEAAKYEFQEKSAQDKGEKKTFNLYGPPPKTDTPVSRHKWRHPTPRAVSGDLHRNTGSDPSSLGVKSLATLPVTKRLKVCHDVECAVPDSEGILASMNRIYVPALSCISTSGDQKADSVNRHSFGEPATDKTFANGGPKSKSHEHLNKRFSASEWNGVFQGGDFFSPTTSSNGKRSGSSTSPTRDQSTTRQDSASQPNATSLNEDSSKQQKPAPFAPGKFSADAWAQQLQNNTWAVPHTEIGKQQTNPRSTRSPRKQSRSTAKPATRPQQATVSSEAEEEEATIFETNNRGSAEATVGTPEAMEIDEEPPNKAQAPPVDGAAEPVTARAESNKSASQPNGANKTGSGEATGNGGKANGAKNDLFNLKNLNDVSPFTSTNSAGIDDLKDIQANLPFESRPNNPNVGRRVVRPRELNLPNPPKRPRRPAVVPAGNDPRQMVLPRKAWERYVAEMSAYMREWNEFNRLMLRHFNARQEAVETGLSPQWISAVGDSTRLNVNAEDGSRDADAGEVDDTDDNLVPGKPTGGFNAYLRGIEEDFKVRQHWEVSWERHRACILELGELRDWIRNGGKVVA